jgi:hypothetical protein
VTPPILYKYCTPTGVDVLRNLRIKVTPPNQFNDPFELAPRMEQEMSREQAFNSLTEPLVLARTYKQAIDSNQFVGTYDEFLRFIREYSEHFAQGLIKRYPESATEFRRDHINMVSEKVGLVCLSEVPDDILMWSHYSGSHTGLVIGFRTTHPFFANPPLLKVDYQKERILVGHSVKKDDDKSELTHLSDAKARIGNTNGNGGSFSLYNNVQQRKTVRLAVFIILRPLIQLS